MPINKIKQLVGETVVALVQQDMVIGIGTGSTVFYFIEALGKKVKNGLKCVGVPTSKQTKALAAEHGIALVELNDISSIDLTVDGADEIDEELRLIKGGGGALLQEKMVAAASKKLVIIADENKFKKGLGGFPLPVEVVPYGWKQVQQHIHEQYPIKSELRLHDNKPFVTDHGHYILDCPFKKIDDAMKLNTALHLIAGVVETGLFIDMCNMAIIGYPDGTVRHITSTT
ncbi:MAG: ribose-5-phosphate isomerase RpiA [Chitinophagaceae bacterium]